MSKFEHLDTTNEGNDASLDDEKAGLCNGDKEQGDTGSSLSDTEDDLNNSKHEELSDDSMLSDDAMLTERARLPSKCSPSIVYCTLLLCLTAALKLSGLKHLNKDRATVITKRRPTRPKRESYGYED